MTALPTEENLSALLHKSADNLFEEYPVEDVGTIIEKLSVEAATKRADLKYLVGNKYRDLLNVADDIIKMSDITVTGNEQLMDLAFKKSNYSTKYLPNLSQFNDTLRDGKIKKTQQNNRPIIFQNVVHDLNYSLIGLKHEILAEYQQLSNNTDDQYSTNSNTYDHGDVYKNENADSHKSMKGDNAVKFLHVAKHIYLIQHYFPEEISHNPHSFSVIKYKQLHQEFTDLVEKLVKKLRYESDLELISNLTISYMISWKISATQSLQWLLSKRKEHVLKLANSKVNLEDLLNYIYITLEFFKALKTRMSIHVNRLKNNSGNQNWIQQTSFKKWIKWIEPNENCTPFAFEISANDGRIDDTLLDSSVIGWKRSLSEGLVSNFKRRLDKSSDSLLDLVLLLKYVLTSFKIYSSLTKLPMNEGYIVYYVVDQWKATFASKLKSQLGKLSDICGIIITNFESESVILAMQLNSKIAKFNKYSNDFDIVNFLDLSGSSNDDDIFKALDQFRADLKIASNSVESLKSTSVLLTKSVISVDDYEDEELWSSISSQLNTFLMSNIDMSVKLLNESIQNFAAKVSEKLKEANSHYSNSQLLYLLRVLANLEEKIQLEEIYNTFSKYSKISSDQRIDLSKQLNPLIEQCFHMVVKSVYENSFAEQFRKVFTERLADHSSDFPESILWETTSDDKKLPTAPSIKVQTLLASFCEDILHIDGQNYSKLFTLTSFEAVRNDTIDTLIALFSDLSTATDKERISTDSVLLTYADFLFISCLKDETLRSIDAEKESLFVEILPELSTIEYSGQIKQALTENFRNQSLLYFPLSK